MKPDSIRASVRDRYRAVAGGMRDFPYPVGRESALRLGYDLSGMPDSVVEGFVGVGNPFLARRPAPGERVLDLGCGSGLDALVAGAVGIDLTVEMLAAGGIAADAERLPFADRVFHQVISNGVLNLVPDKDAAFREIARVLRPGGTLAAADLLIVDSIPPEVLADADAWST